MPPEVIKFPYSKKSGYAALAVLVILIGLMLKTAVTSLLAGDNVGAGIFGVFILLLVAVLGLMIVTRLVPAFKKETALELDELGIKDYIRNLELEWKDIHDIGLKPGRSSAMLILEMKQETDYGKQIFISLRWVEGKDIELYNTILAYFDEVEGIDRETDEVDAEEDESEEEQ